VGIVVNTQTTNRCNVERFLEAGGSVTGPVPSLPMLFENTQILMKERQLKYCNPIER